ncbi:MAG: glycosyltransferase [Bryobacteraceae bacterium]
MSKPWPDSNGSRALLLAPEAPYPLAGGGALRSASMLEFLAQRYALDVIVFRQPGQAAPAFPEGRVREALVIDLPHHGRGALARAARNVSRMARRAPPLVDRFVGFGERIGAFVDGREYALAVIEHFWCAPYVDQISPRARRTVLNLHNIESVWHQRLAQTSRGARAMGHRVFQAASEELERQWLPRFSVLLAPSAEDAGRAARIAPSAPVVVYPNAIPRVERPAAVERDAIAFSATFDYAPNQEGVRWFHRQVWPILRERRPGLVWRLIGRNPGAVRREIDGDPRIECTGPVESALDHLAAAKVVVAPLLTGSGTRLKIIEAWAAARAVVSTAIGAEGLPARDRENIMIEDHPSQFADAVSRLLDSPVERERLGNAGRSIYERELTWDSAWRTIEAELGGF